jgi:hypothetical protein
MLQIWGLSECCQAKCYTNWWKDCSLFRCLDLLLFPLWAKHLDHAQFLYSGAGYVIERCFLCDGLQVAEHVAKMRLRYSILDQGHQEAEFLLITVHSFLLNIIYRSAFHFSYSPPLYFILLSLLHHFPSPLSSRLLLLIFFSLGFSYISFPLFMYLFHPHHLLLILYLLFLHLPLIFFFPPTQT